MDGRGHATLREDVSHGAAALEGCLPYLAHRGGQVDDLKVRAVVDGPGFNRGEQAPLGSRQAFHAACAGQRVVGQRVHPRRQPDLLVEFAVHQGTSCQGGGGSRQNGMDAAAEAGGPSDDLGLGAVVEHALNTRIERVLHRD